MIQIELKYKLWGGEEINVPLDATDYFEESEGPFTLDSVPEFDHVYQYLEEDLEDIQSTCLILTDTDSGESTSFKENFWNQGKCFCIEVKSSKDAYYELIVNLKGTSPETDHVVRWVRSPEGISPIYHGEFLKEGDQEKETIFYPRK